jgi:hypothetical protein
MMCLEDLKDGRVSEFVGVGVTFAINYYCVLGMMFCKVVHRLILFYKEYNEYTGLWKNFEWR